MLLALRTACAWQTDIDYSLRGAPPARSASHPDAVISLDSGKTSGKWLPSAVPILEGGFSGLWKDPADPSGHTFLSVTERGPVASWGGSGLAFPMPDYHQKLVRLRVQGDSLALISLDSLRTGDGQWTTGLPSPDAAVPDTAYAMLDGSVMVDASRKLPVDTNGHDFEGIAGDGKGMLWISDEQGPSLLQVDASSSTLKRRWSRGQGIPAVFGHARNNRGFEALAVTPAGRVVAMLQSPMTNPDKLKKDSTRLVRILELDPRSGSTRQFAFLVDLKGGRRPAGDVRISDLCALSDSTFLALETGETQDGTAHVDLVHFTISASSTDISLLGGDDAAGLLKPVNGKSRTIEQLAGIHDTTILASAGIRPVVRTTVIAELLQTTRWTHLKPEGLALIDDSTVALINDNDFGANAKDDDGMLHQLSAERTRTRIQYLRWRMPVTSAIRSGSRKATWKAKGGKHGIELESRSAGGPWRLTRPDGHLLAHVPASPGPLHRFLAVSSPGIVILQDGTSSQTLGVLP
ncbi:MAG: hypothetical protein RL318_2940 [Fibrobacterota bacterium]